ncbi:unnamed protein product, partial [Rodentolepis nana]|uniref:LINE-1 retrotransposable element ORF2 protein n=1 Tax=Rodentolepis nana TaxID=102285 RepID=A0A0R3TIB7_RODNA
MDDWPIFTNLLENELYTSPLNFNQHPDKFCNGITNIMIRWAKKTIPRGKTKHFRVFWSRHLEELKRRRDALRNTADQSGRMEGVQAWRQQSAEDIATPNNVLTEPFRPCKLNAAIKQLKCKKSPGEDGIHPEFLIRMGPKAKETMLTLYNKIWETSLVPN